jgi:hypothetical protein
MLMLVLLLLLVLRVRRGRRMMGQAGRKRRSRRMARVRRGIVWILLEVGWGADRETDDLDEARKSERLDLRVC